MFWICVKSDEYFILATQITSKVMKDTSLYKSFSFQAVFERLVDMICDKMSESLDADPGLNSNKGTRLTDTAQPSNVNCNC